jgi:NADH-quinone oxidoreductase subunit N
VPFAQAVDWAAIAPPVILVLAAVGTLLADLVLAGRRPDMLAGIGLIGSLATLGAVLGLAAEDRTRRTFCAAGACSYIGDHFALLLQGLFAVVALVVVLLTLPSVQDRRVPAGETYFLLLSSFAGMVTLAASRDLLLLVLALEVVSLPGFVLAGLRRSDPRSAEAALKFFLISVLSTAVMLYGISLVYGVTGSVQLQKVSAALSRPELRQPVTAAAFALVVVGFAFKVSAVPFHTWAPDTYTGAPVPVAAFLSVASKAAGFAGLVVVLVAGFAPYAHVWGPMVAIIAALTMTVGNLAALGQQNVVRLLAWSSIAQSGYILVPLGTAATATGRADLGSAVSASLAYLAVYAVMNLAAFACVVAVNGRRPRGAVADYRGLASESLPLALALAFALACLAGLPPGLVGLFAKVVVFRATISGAVAWLGVLLAVNTVLGLYYYARLGAALFSPAEDRAAEPVPVPVALAAAIAVPLVLAVLLGFWPELVLHLTPLAAPTP